MNIHEKTRILGFTGASLSYLYGLLARCLGLVILGLLMLLAALRQVGIVCQAAEEGRHHGAGVHFLLRTQKQEGWDQSAYLGLRGNNRRQLRKRKRQTQHCAFKIHSHQPEVPVCPLHSNQPLILSGNGGKRVCEPPYLKQGHVLLVVLLALLGGGIAAVDEGAALLRVTVTCQKQTAAVRRRTHSSRLGLPLHPAPRVGHAKQHKRS